MKREQKHAIAQRVVDVFRTRVQRTHADLFRYPLSVPALSVMIGETYQVAIHAIDGLDIRKIRGVVERVHGRLDVSVLDEYSALAGFLYAHRGGGMIFIEASDTEERKKFSIAHELGHFINEYYEPVFLKYEAANTIPLFTQAHTEEMRQVVAARCTKQDIFGGHEPDVAGSPKKEVQRLLERFRHESKNRFNEIRANLFAAELLMPLEECARLESRCVQENLDPVEEVRRHFGVSRQAATYRVEELQLCRRELELF